MARIHINDEKWMRIAIGLAKRGLGRVAPNPAVGCLLVKNEQVVGRGWTQPGGRPHAETEAILQAGEEGRGSTAYVTLEPCSHTGQTPPCSQALIQAGICRVVVAAIDPDPRVSGQGVKNLKAAGIEVVTGILEQEARNVNHGFLMRVTEKRPSFTLKLASTLDGKIALANGESKWITRGRARSFGHLMRAEHDGILVGVNTIIADDPSLTCRIPGLEMGNPTRIVLDSNLRTPTSAQVLDVNMTGSSTILVTKSGNNAGKYEQGKIEVVEVDTPHNPVAVAEALGTRGLNSIMIEGGAQVAASFLTAGLVDKISIFYAGKILGNNGLGSIGDLELASLPDAPHFMLTGIRRLGPDMLATYRKAE